MPPQIFQPLYKRQETREDFQREMEFAFEDMYTGERSKDRSVVQYSVTKQNDNDSESNIAPQCLDLAQLCFFYVGFLNLNFVQSQGLKATWSPSWPPSPCQLCPQAARTKSWTSHWMKSPHREQKTHHMMPSANLRALSRKHPLQVKRSTRFTQKLN